MPQRRKNQSRICSGLQKLPCTVSHSAPFRAHVGIDHQIKPNGKFASDFKELVSDGVFGLRPIPETAFVEVLRFELTVERGLCEAATSIREEA